MQIHNVTRGVEVATAAGAACSYGARLKGLMAQPPLPPGGGLLLEPESSIHTFFMRYPIDVLYLDREYRVLRATGDMAPYRVGPIFTRGCYAILELPAGTIRSTRTQVGDQLRLSGAG